MLSGELPSHAPPPRRRRVFTQKSVRIAPASHLQPNFTPPVGRRAPSAAEPRIVEATRHPLRPLNHLDLPFSQALARHNAERPDIFPIPYWAILEQARRVRDALLLAAALDSLSEPAVTTDNRAEQSRSPQNFLVPAAPAIFPFPRIGAVSPLPPQPLTPAPSPYALRPHATKGRLIDAVV